MLSLLIEGFFTSLIHILLPFLGGIFVLSFMTSFLQTLFQLQDSALSSIIKLVGLFISFTYSYQMLIHEMQHFFLSVVACIAKGGIA